MLYFKNDYNFVNVIPSYTKRTDSEGLCILYKVIQLAGKDDDK